MDEQLPHFSHDQSEVAARPWTLFKWILSLNLQIHDLCVLVVVTTVCVLLMVGAGDIRNMQSGLAVKQIKTA